MTDLEERLRNENFLWTVPGALRKEAADEIDRLKADKTAISDTASFFLHENEKLRAALRDLLKDYLIMASDAPDLDLVHQVEGLLREGE
jgi:hypothetical protein